MREADEYEAAYMAEGGPALHREKMSFPRWFRYFTFASIGIGVGLGAAGAAASGAWATALLLGLMLPVMLGFVLLMSTLRVTVTDQKLLVQSGPFGPSIPLDRIETCEAESYSLWKYGGYGIRYSVVDGSWCYNMLGDKGKAVRVHYRTDSGKLKKVVIASADNVGLARAINRARTAEASPDEDEVVLSAADDADVGVEAEAVEQVEA